MNRESFKKNHKKAEIVLFVICCILLIMAVFLYSRYVRNHNFSDTNGIIENSENLYFAFYVDDVVNKTMPAKDSGYVLDTEKSFCTNGAIPSLNLENWSIKVDHLTTAHTRCTLYFRIATFSESFIQCNLNGNSAQCFLDNASLNENELAYDETVDNNLRYIGSNPNNYVYFNCDDYSNPSKDTCELWRIIGVMNNVELGEGSSKSSLIKLIRDEPVGSYSWDNKPYGIGSSISNYGSNDWSDSRLMMLLNPGYESVSDSSLYGYEGSLYYNAKSGTCYSGLAGASVSCDFTNTGLKNDATRNMIENVLWKTGGAASFDNLTANDFYVSERSNHVYNNHALDWNGKVALLYASDFGFATNGGSLGRDSCLASSLYNWYTSEYLECLTNSWLYTNTAYWTLLPNSSTSDALIQILGSGYVDGRAAEVREVFPTIYLKSEVVISEGDGSVSNPFVLSRN